MLCLGGFSSGLRLLVSVRYSVVSWDGSTCHLIHEWLRDYIDLRSQFWNSEEAERW
jgi:hypothetical protein